MSKSIDSEGSPKMLLGGSQMLFYLSYIFYLKKLISIQIYLFVYKLASIKRRGSPK